MKQYQDTAIVLARSDYGERDRIINLLCKEHGKVSVLAKGVRAAKSKLAGGIELFSETEVSIIRGKASLGTLTSSRLLHYYSSIVKDMSRTTAAYDYLKVINQITHDETGQEYYPILAQTIAALDDPAFAEPVIQIWFEMQLLTTSGSIPNLQTDTTGKPLQPDVSYNFDYDEQAFSAAERGGFTAEHIKLLRLCEAHARVPRIQAADEVLQMTTTLTHRLLRLYLQ